MMHSLDAVEVHAMYALLSLSTELDAPTRSVSQESRSFADTDSPGCDAIMDSPCIKPIAFLCLFLFIVGTRRSDSLTLCTHKKQCQVCVVPRECSCKISCVILQLACAVS